MLSHLLGRHVSRETRSVLQLSLIRKARCRKYSTQGPVGLFEELTERGFVHDVTWCVPLYSLPPFLTV
jgi:hypothetical protein